MQIILTVFLIKNKAEAHASVSARTAFAVDEVWSNRKFGGRSTVLPMVRMSGQNLSATKGTNIGQQRFF